MGLPDPRTYGSGNIGDHQRPALGEPHRGAAHARGRCGQGLGRGDSPRRPWAPTAGRWPLVGFSAFIGHVYPVWLRFHGGKGVATAAGVLVALDWRVGLAVIAAWLAIAVVSRYSSLAAIVAARVAPVAAWYFVGTGAGARVRWRP